MHFISSFYKFVLWKDQFNLATEDIEKQILQWTQEQPKLSGLVILGHEGINSTCASSDPEVLEKFKDFVRKLVADPHLEFKDSQAEVQPFRRLSIKLRSEIVNLGHPELFP